MRGGRYHDVAWAFDELPAFVREGSVLPLAAVVQHSDELEGADITFRCYGKRAQGRFREDDGASRAYEMGAYNEWSLQLEGEDLRILRTHAGYGGAKRRYFVETRAGQRRRRLRMP